MGDQRARVLDGLRLVQHHAVPGHLEQHSAAASAALRLAPLNCSWSHECLQAPCHCCISGVLTARPQGVLPQFITGGGTRIRLPSVAV